MHKNATKCNETLRKWCKNKHGASKIIDTFEPYQGHGEAIREISRTGRCAITGSTGCAPSRWLTPARVAGIEGAAAEAIQSREPEREEKKGGASFGRVGSDRATWSGSTRCAGAQQVGQRPDRWARRGF
jgi:hypothetical protein